MCSVIDREVTRGDLRLFHDLAHLLLGSVMGTVMVRWSELWLRDVTLPPALPHLHTHTLTITTTPHAHAHTHATPLSSWQR